MNILQVNTVDVAGGAETLVRDLHGALRNLGNNSTVIVGRREHRMDGFASLYDLFPPAEHPFLERIEAALRSQIGRIHGARPGADAVAILRDPYEWLRSVLRRFDLLCGAEDFRYPRSRRIMEVLPRPDVLQLHNLHGGYFDLRQLPRLSRWAPCNITVHDLWLLTGYCSYGIDCDDRWQSGCGECPFVAARQDVVVDRTRRNLEDKARIYREARPYVVVPSRWLSNQVAQSVLAPALGGIKVIPHGVDQAIFCPADSAAARRALSLPEQAFIVLIAGQSLRRYTVKNHEAVDQALESVAEKFLREVVYVRLGDEGPDRQVGRVSMLYRPFADDRQVMARYYQAADVYTQPSRKEAWGLSVTEALSCGTPVIGSNVGGILDQVKSYGPLDRRPVGERFRLEEATGVLVEPDDSETMASVLLALAADHALRKTLGANAATYAAGRFSAARMARDYLDWYQEIRTDWMSNVIGVHPLGKSRRACIAAVDGRSRNRQGLII